MSTVLRPNIIPSNLLENKNPIRVQAQQTFNSIVENADRFEKSKTPHPSKNITEVFALIKGAIEDYQTREKVNEDATVNVSYNHPTTEIETELITMSLKSRIPGAFSQGRPFEGSVKNRRPMLREYVEDPNNPGYKLAVMGFWYDNEICLTCWARTVKAAHYRALWLENVMEEYSWYFASSGVSRLLYQRRTTDETKIVKDIIFYGCSLEYFVRDEKITTVSEKKLEDIAVSLSVLQS